MYTLLIPILLPIVAGAVMPKLKFPSREARNIYVGIVTILNSVVLFHLILSGETYSCAPLRLTEHLTITLKMDGLSRVFGALIAFLWPLAALYAFEYMKGDEGSNHFFAFYVMTYGVTLGVATCYEVAFDPAYRDAVLNGVEISNGDFIGFIGKEMLVAHADKATAAHMLLEKMLDGKFMLTVFCGKDASDEERAALEAHIAEAHPDIEAYVLDGGQDIYPYIFIAE